MKFRLKGILSFGRNLHKSSLVEKDGNNYGIINIPKFYIDFENQDTDAAKDLEIEINRLKDQGVQGLVIDLRNNGNGSLQSLTWLVCLSKVVLWYRSSR